jgi:hypothetical protein
VPVIVPAGLTGSVQAADLYLMWPVRHWYSLRMLEAAKMRSFGALSEREWHPLLVEHASLAWYRDLTFDLRKAAEGAGVLFPPPKSPAEAKADPRAPTFDLGGGVSFSLSDALSPDVPAAAAQSRLLPAVIAEISAKRSKPKKKHTLSEETQPSRPRSPGARGRESAFDAFHAGRLVLPDNFGVGFRKKESKRKASGTSQAIFIFVRLRFACTRADVPTTCGRECRRCRESELVEQQAEQVRSQRLCSG